MKVNNGITKVWPYVVSQYIGAFLGALLCNENLIQLIMWQEVRSNLKPTMELNK